MADTIRLYSPQEIPFGKLSNNSYHPIVINGKKYSTVTNYIFANMATNPSNRNLLQHAEITKGKGSNKELLNAIDYLIKSTEKNSEVKSIEVNEETTLHAKKRQKKITQLTKAYDKDRSYYEEMTDEKLDRSYKKLLKTQEKQKKIAALVKESKKSKEHYEKMTDEQIDRRYKKIKLEENQESKTPEITDEDIQKAFEEMEKAEEEIKKEKSFDSPKRELYKQLISREVRAPFESVDLRALKHRIIDEENLNAIGIYKLMDNVATNELYETIFRATDEGFRQLITGKPETDKDEIRSLYITDILIKTGNRPIIFDSHDLFLGTGTDGRGFNIVGKVLMQIRHSIRMTDIVHKREMEYNDKKKRIVDIYTAYTILREEIDTNKNILDEYIGLDVQQIIDKYGLDRISSKLPSEDVIMKMYSECSLNDIIMNEIEKPDTIVHNVRKFRIKNLQYALKDYKKDIIFNSYLEYIIERKFADDIGAEVDKIYISERLDSQDISGSDEPDEESVKNRIRAEVVENIMINEKTKLSHEKLISYREKIADLFNLGMLSASLSDRIDADIEDLQIPTDKEVRKIQNMKVETAEAKCEVKQPVDSSSENEEEKDSNQIENFLKSTLGYEKKSKSSLIKAIIKIKGGVTEDYNDMSKKELKMMLDEESVKEVKKEGKEFVAPEGEPVIIYRNDENNPPENRPFNPQSYTGMLKIKNMYYPTIYHYILANLIGSTGTKRTVEGYGNVLYTKGMGIQEAHKLILVDDNVEVTEPTNYKALELVTAIYDEENKKAINFLTSLSTVTALNKKFEDPELRNLLLATGNNNIEWCSPYKPFNNLSVGTDKNKGNNYVGKVMMDIRETIREKMKLDDVTIQVTDINRIVQSDTIIKTWVTMRLRDMCTTVNKFQKYLKLKDDFDYDLNHDLQLMKLINFVLDNIYSPCNLITNKMKKENYKMPSFVLDTIGKCAGMSAKELSVKTMSVKGNIVWNKKIHEKIDENSRKIQKLNDEFYGLSNIEHTKQEAEEFSRKQRKEFDKFMRDLNRSDTPQEDKLKEMNNFKQFQTEEYNDFWGVKKLKEKTDADFLKHNNDIAELEKELSAFLRDAQSKEAHYFSIIKEVAQLYWNKIATMLLFVVKDLSKSSTTYNIRNLLIKAGELTSEHVKCVRIVSNKETNCIVSAILHLLSNISKFKQEFSSEQALDTDDVLLTGSIILNVKYEPRIRTSEALEVIKEESEGSSSSDVLPDEFFPEIEKSEGESESEDYDFKFSFDDKYEEGEEEEKMNEFTEEEINKAFDELLAEEMGKSSNSSDSEESSKSSASSESEELSTNENKKLIKKHLLKISDKSDNYDDMVLEIIKMVETISTSDISEKIKTNRINFFASLK